MYHSSRNAQVEVDGRVLRFDDDRASSRASSIIDDFGFEVSVSKGHFKGEVVVISHIRGKVNFGE